MYLKIFYNYKILIILITYISLTQKCCNKSNINCDLMVIISVLGTETVMDKTQELNSSHYTGLMISLNRH